MVNKENGFDFLLGRKLGEGATRTVYEMKFNPKYVIKVEDSLPVANINEHQFWFQMYDFQKWLSPVVDISPCGRFLIMEKTKPLRIEEVPTEGYFPWWTSDLKLENMGWLNGKVVLHDYGLFAFYNWLHPNCTQQRLNIKTGGDNHAKLVCEPRDILP